MSAHVARFGKLALLLLILGGLFLSGRAWLHDHPQHNPWAPLNLNDPPGWATARKLAALRDNPEECRAVLERSGVVFTALEPAGEGECRREDRTIIGDNPLYPAEPRTTCAVGAAVQLWLRQGVQPAAAGILGSRVETLEHLGTYSCRRLYGRDSGRWSEHATGNAIDISAFVLEDGRRISVLADWSDGGEQARFLREVRDAACGTFSTVLSPYYNAAHADHFHLDQAARGFGSVCR